jgi:hypothetical protein
MGPLLPHSVSLHGMKVRRRDRYAHNWFSESIRKPKEASHASLMVRLFLFENLRFTGQISLL